MPTLPIYNALRTIALDEFVDVVLGVAVLFATTGDALKLRLDIVDGSSVESEAAIREFLVHVRQMLLDGT